MVAVVMLAGHVGRSCWHVVVFRRSLVDEEEPRVNVVVMLAGRVNEEESRVDVVVMLAGRPSLVDEEEPRLIVAGMLAGRVGRSCWQVVVFRRSPNVCASPGTRHTGGLSLELMWQTLWHLQKPIESR